MILILHGPNLSWTLILPLIKMEGPIKRPLESILYIFRNPVEKKNKFFLWTRTKERKQLTLLLHITYFFNLYHLNLLTMMLLQL